MKQRTTCQKTLYFNLLNYFWKKIVLSFLRNIILFGCYNKTFGFCKNDSLKKEIQQDYSYQGEALNVPTRCGSRSFSRRGEADFQKILKLFSIFLWWPNWFSELSKITLKTLFLPNFLRAGNLFLCVLMHFWENLDQKIAFFQRALSPQN